MKHLLLTVALIALGLASAARAADSPAPNSETKSEIIRRLDDLQHSVDALVDGRNVSGLQPPAVGEEQFVAPNRGTQAPSRMAAAPEEKTDIAGRIAALQRSIAALAREEKERDIDHMPGLARQSTQERLMAQLAESVIILYRENQALKEQIAALAPPRT
jgi:hypothetical protein